MSCPCYSPSGSYGYPLRRSCGVIYWPVFLRLPAVSPPARCGPAACRPLHSSVRPSCYAGILLPPSGTRAVWWAWCCRPLDFCRIGEFFSHTREQRGLGENPRKFLRAGDVLAYGLRVCLGIRLPAPSPAPPCGRSFPPGYAPMPGGFFRASARFCPSCLAYRLGHPPGDFLRHAPACA